MDARQSQSQFFPLMGVALLAVLVIAIAFTARPGSDGAHSADEDRAYGALLIESRELRFIDRQDGAVVVLDYRDDSTVDVLEPGTNGFVRGVMRGMARERRSKSVSAEPPYRLAYWSDGRLTLDDPSTGRWVELVAFGPDNIGAFARMLATVPARDQN